LRTKQTERVEEEEDVSSYLMTLGKHTKIWMVKHYTALPCDLVLQEAMDLSQDKLRNEW